MLEEKIDFYSERAYLLLIRKPWAGKIEILFFLNLPQNELNKKWHKKRKTGFSLMQIIIVAPNIPIKMIEWIKNKFHLTVPEQTKLYESFYI